MTTDRTAIRRRLAVGRAANSPPRGGWKSGHRSILAPLAITAAGTVAVRLGLVLARSERERRRERQRDADRQLALAPDEQLAPGLKRMAIGQVDLALELLSAPVCATGDLRAVHETRKALKRLRTLLRLLRAELGEQVYAREDEVLRNIARRLAGARDAEVMLATLDRLIERHPRRLGRRGVIQLRKRLLMEHEHMMQLTLDASATRAQVLTELHAFRAHAMRWALPEDRDAIELAQEGLRRLYQQGRRRYRRAAHAKKSERTRALHDWRKRVKDLRYAAEMLSHRDRPRSQRADAIDRLRKRRRGKDVQAGREELRLRLLARRADKLAEALGEEHDLAVFTEWIEAHSKRSASRSWRVGRGTSKQLLKLIARRRTELQRRVLRRGERLYDVSPKRFVRSIS